MNQYYSTIGEKLVEQIVDDWVRDDFFDILYKEKFFFCEWKSSKGSIKELTY